MPTVLSSRPLPEVGLRAAMSRSLTAAEPLPARLSPPQPRTFVAPSYTPAVAPGRPSPVRIVARLGWRVVAPLARPVLHRLRTFYSQPTFDATERVRRELSRENAQLRTRLQRAETALTAVADLQREFLREYRDDTVRSGAVLADIADRMASLELAVRPINGRVDE